MRFAGSGPGTQTRDGCSVELYLRLPYRGEIDFLADQLPRSASVLELGCGVGRLTRVLLGFGLCVTAVDNSSEMLSHVPIAAQRIEADIGTLRLSDRFDAVLLASCLINVPDAALRDAFLRCAREHLMADGVLFFERHDAAWLRSVEAGRVGDAGAVRTSVREVHREGDVVGMCVVYEHECLEWEQRFTTQVLDDADVDQALAQSGFGPATWIDERRRWGKSAALHSPSPSGTGLG